MMEDSIRSTEFESKGLTDRYEELAAAKKKKNTKSFDLPLPLTAFDASVPSLDMSVLAVSYTHLTLPTICSV